VTPAAGTNSTVPKDDRKFVLSGIVTWKRPCYETDEFYLRKYTFVTATEEFLPILLKTLAKEIS